MTTAVGVVTRRMTLDDYLGPGDRRFFGSGYKRADQRLRDIEISTDEEGHGTIRARASVSYPTDWSRKGRTDQPPHLSSIDVLLITGEIAELYLTHTLNLSPAARSRMRLRNVHIRAGQKPVDHELADFPVTATVGDLGDLPDAPGMRVSFIDCLVGALRVRCDIEHPGVERRRNWRHRPSGRAVLGRRAQGPYRDPDELLGPATRRPFAVAHRMKSQLVDRLDIDADSLRAEADCTVIMPKTIVYGLESNSYAGVSIIDAFVVAIQLGQVLLYELDQMDRADSNTLWMRQTTLEIDDPTPDSPGVTTGHSRITATLEQPELLVAADGGTWRTSVIAARCENMRIRCSVAHQLPASALR